MKLRLVFHVAKTDAGYTATMDSPDQGAKGIPMTSARFENNVLTLEHNLAQIVYAGTVDKEQLIQPTVLQGNLRRQVSLSL